MLRFRGRGRSCGDPIKARKGPAQSSGHDECRALNNNKSGPHMGSISEPISTIYSRGDACRASGGADGAAVIRSRPDWDLHNPQDMWIAEHQMKQMQVLAYGKHRLAQRLLESAGSKTRGCYSELRDNSARHLNLKHAPTDFIIQPP